MELTELMAMQREFDQRRAGKVEFYTEISDDNIRDLEHLVVCLVGEVGEIANLTKKLVRGDFALKEARPQLHSEIVDAFIYVIKMCNQLGVDLEPEYVKKLNTNVERFKHFER